MQRQARTTARKRAAEGAQRDINAAVERGFQEQAQLQRQLNEQWRRLLGNEPDVVFATLTEAFEEWYRILEFGLIRNPDVTDEGRSRTIDLATPARDGNGKVASKR